MKNKTDEIVMELNSLSDQEEILDRIYQYILRLKKRKTLKKEKDWLPSLDLHGKLDNVNIRDLAYSDDID